MHYFLQTCYSSPSLPLGSAAAKLGFLQELAAELEAVLVALPAS